MDRKETTKFLSDLLIEEVRWEMKVIYPCNHGNRKRSMTELLFCMLRSGH